MFFLRQFCLLLFCNWPKMILGGTLCLTWIRSLRVSMQWWLREEGPLFWAPIMSMATPPSSESVVASVVFIGKADFRRSWLRQQGSNTIIIIVLKTMIVIRLFSKKLFEIGTLCVGHMVWMLDVWPIEATIEPTGNPQHWFVRSIPAPRVNWFPPGSFSNSRALDKILSVRCEVPQLCRLLYGSASGRKWRTSSHWAERFHGAVGN